MDVWVHKGKSIGAWMLLGSFIFLGQGMWGIYGYLMYVFPKFFSFSWGYLGFSRASSDCLCTTPYTLAMTVIRGLKCHPAVFNIWMRGSYLIVILFLLWQYLGIYHGSRWILWFVCTVFNGFGGIGAWPSMRNPSRHNMSGHSWAMHVHVLGRHVHYINQSIMVMSWG